MSGDGTVPAGDGRGESGPGGGRPTPPRALVVSCALGALSLVLLVVGLVADAEAVSVTGVGAATLSLGAALYWRAELITAWGERKADRRG